MTRSSAKELFTPFKDLKREFRSYKKLFKTLSLDESRSSVSNLFSDQEENSEEEITKTMAKTMEQYMSKTRADYVSGVARPEIKDKDHFELKGQFLKELQENTFNSSDHEDANEHIDKRCNLVLYGLEVPTRQILDSKCAIPTKTVVDVKVAIQEMAEYSQKWHNETSRGRTKRHKENSNMNKKIQDSTDAAIRNQGASIKNLEIQIGQMSKSISTTIEADTNSMCRMGFSQYAVSTQQDNTLMYESRQTTIPFSSCLNNCYCNENKEPYGSQFSEAYSYEASHINKSIPRKKKDPGSFTLPCYINNVCFNDALADLGASISVMPLSTYLNLGLGKLAHTKLTVELADRTVKYPKGIDENILVEIVKFVFLVDFVILDMPRDIKVPLILIRPFLSTAHAKIDVFKRNITLRVGEEKIIFKSIKPVSSLIKRVYMLELRRDHVDDLMPTIEEGEVVEEFRARNDARIVSKNFGYPSDCDHDMKIHIDYAYNLKKDKLEYKGNNVVGALMNIPIFVGTFSILTDFAVLDNMDAYRDEGMGDVIFGEPLLREFGINARWFEGMITIYNGNEEVIYQMDPNISEMRRWKNRSHVSTLACMRPNDEAEEKV
nr:hypothetical protein [Tanacetum cinerariifolium]